MLKKEKETAEKIAARAYTQRYLAGLLPAVFTSLRSHGYFYDSVQLGGPLSPAILSNTIHTHTLSDAWLHHRFNATSEGIITSNKIASKSRVLFHPIFVSYSQTLRLISCPG